MRRLQGLLIDPVDGARPGWLTIENGVIETLEVGQDGEGPLIFPGFVDLQIYDWSRVHEQGVTGYLATCGTSPRGTVDRFLAELPEPCLGAHVEGPYLNPAAAGAQAREHIREIDLGELDAWLAAGRVQMVTLAPEVTLATEAIDRIAAAGAVPAIGHTLAEPRTVSAGIDAGARFATHVWNAMGLLHKRAPGPIGALLLDERVTLGLIADGRHVDPLVEDLTVRAAGPARIALTSDIVAPPQERPDGSLLGGDRCGAALVARMARHGLAEAAHMASLVPARVLGLADRGRLAPGYRADVAVLDRSLAPLETIVGGETVWARA